METYITYSNDTYTFHANGVETVLVPNKDGYLRLPKNDLGREWISCKRFEKTDRVEVTAHVDRTRKDKVSPNDIAAWIKTNRPDAYEEAVKALTEDSKAARLDRERAKLEKQIAALEAKLKKL